jgi:hypothetical protein
VSGTRKIEKADEDFAVGRGTTYKSDEAFLEGLEKDLKPLDADS